MRPQASMPDKYKVAQEVLHKVSAVKLGKLSPHLRPFVDIKAVALKHVLTVNFGMKEEHWPRFFKMLNSFINFTELANVQKLSELAKLDIAIAASIDKPDEDYDNRRPLFAI